MIQLRPYKLSDSEYVLNWANDELVFSNMEMINGEFMRWQWKSNSYEQNYLGEVK